MEIFYDYKYIYQNTNSKCDLQFTTNKRRYYMKENKIK